MAHLFSTLPLAPGAGPGFVTSSVDVHGKAFHHQITAGRTGKLRNLYAHVNNYTADYDIGIYDTQATRQRLWSKGSTAGPATNGFRNLGDPNLDVVAGKVYELAIAAFNGSYWYLSGTNVGSFYQDQDFWTLPDTYIATDGAAQKMWSMRNSSGVLASTIAEASLIEPTGSSYIPLIFGRIE